MSTTGQAAILDSLWARTLERKSDWTQASISKMVKKLQIASVDEDAIHSWLIWVDAGRVTGEQDTESDTHKAARVLLASALVGCEDLKDVSWLADVDEADVVRFGNNLLTAGLWSKTGLVDGSEWFGDAGGVAFNLHVCVAMGEIGRSPKASA